MMELSAEQQDVVAAPLAPLCVIACAGSGKTRTAVHRLAELRRRLDADRRDALGRGDRDRAMHQRDARARSGGRG